MAYKLSVADLESGLGLPRIVRDLLVFVKFNVVINNTMGNIQPWSLQLVLRQFISEDKEINGSPRTRTDVY